MNQELLKNIEDFLKGSNEPGIIYPDSVSNLLNEKNSTLKFAMKFKNTCTSDKEICIFTGGIPHNRITPLVINGANRDYVAIGGSTVSDSAPAGIVPADFLFNDYPNIINQVSGFSVDCVATNSYKYVSQYVYKDATGYVLSTQVSQYAIIDFLREFVKSYPFRIFEIQLGTGDTSVFTKKFTIKKLSPFTQNNAETIEISDYFSPDNANNSKVVINKEFVVDANTFMSLTLPATLSSLTITFKVSLLYSKGDLFQKLTNKQEFFKNISKIK